MQEAAVRKDGRHEFVVNKPVAGSAGDPYLRTGATFRESLRDGRHIILNGRDVPDVTLEPTLAPGIDQLARYFDAQHAPETRDKLTTVDTESGRRISTAWLVPRTTQDLWRYDEMMKCSTALTFGIFGRPRILRSSEGDFVRGLEPSGPKGGARGGRQDFTLSEGRARENNLTSADIII